MATVTEANAFLTWFSSWGQVIYVIAQMVFWGGLAVAAIVIALQYKRFVTYKIGKPAHGEATPVVAETGAEETKPGAVESAPSVSVEEFVE